MAILAPHNNVRVAYLLQRRQGTQTTKIQFSIPRLILRIHAVDARTPARDTIRVPPQFEIIFTMLAHQSLREIKFAFTANPHSSSARDALRVSLPFVFPPIRGSLQIQQDASATAPPRGTIPNRVLSQHDSPPVPAQDTILNSLQVLDDAGAPASERVSRAGA